MPLLFVAPIAARSVRVRILTCAMTGPRRRSARLGRGNSGAGVKEEGRAVIVEEKLAVIKEEPRSVVKQEARSVVKQETRMVAGEEPMLMLEEETAVTVKEEGVSARRPKRRKKEEHLAYVQKGESKMVPKTEGAGVGPKKEGTIRKTVSKREKKTPLDTWKMVDIEDGARVVTATLAEFYPRVVRRGGTVQRDGTKVGEGAHGTVLDCLIATILSQATSRVNSTRAFSALKATYATWEAAADAGAESVEDCIRCGGLAKAKAARIVEILRGLREEHGNCTLEHLRECTDDSVKRELCALPGVGPKTAACVLMFGMQRAEFPVDTHVRRITQKLGWVAKGVSAERTYDALNATVPNELKYDLHVLLIEHGRNVCKARAPNCAQCPLAEICPAAAIDAGNADELSVSSDASW